MLDAFRGGGGSETINVLLWGVVWIHYNTRQRWNDKQLLREVDSIHWNTRQRRDDKQILIVGIDSGRTQSGRLQRDKVKIRDFNSWRRFRNDTTNTCSFHKNWRAELIAWWDQSSTNRDIELTIVPKWLSKEQRERKTGKYIWGRGGHARRSRVSYPESNAKHHCQS